jgi:hypothetical protein
MPASSSGGRRGIVSEAGTAGALGSVDVSAARVAVGLARQSVDRRQ